MLFTTPLVYAFTAESQFGLVAADRSLLTTEAYDVTFELACNLVQVTQMTGYSCGVAVRRRKLETCLVSIPIEEPEKSSGRTGLAVVLGAVTSAKVHGSPRMYHEMLQTVLVPRLLGLLPPLSDRSLVGWAEALTHDYQTLDGETLGQQTMDEVVRVARLYTSLMHGYRSSALGNWADAGSVSGALLVAQTQIECLVRSGKNQVAFLMPFGKSEGVPILKRNITTHRFVGDDVLMCVSGTLNEVFTKSDG